MKDLPTTPPPKVIRTPRLPARARSLQPGHYVDASDQKTAHCIVSYGQHQGWTMRRKTDRSLGVVRVWRIS